MAPLEIGSEAVPFAVNGEADAVAVMPLASLIGSGLAGRMRGREVAVPSSPRGGMLG